jgi:branched-chain amino acid transport system substrate-binding protein
MKSHVAVGLGACAVFLVTACGSDNKAGGTTTAPPPAAVTTVAAPTDTQPAPAVTAAPAATVPATDAPAPTVAGPATGEPIKIGFVNLEGGPISLPELRIGVQTAADYANAHGGANGRPLQIIPCNVDGTPEKSIDCANQLVSQGVVLIFEGYDPSSDAMLPVLDSAGIAITGHAAFGPQQQVSENAFFFGTANPSFTAGFLDYYAKSGAKTIMMFLPDNPAFRDAADTIVDPVSKIVGLDTKTTFYDPSSVNWESLATTALAENPDVVATVAPDGDCLGLLGALRSVAYGGEIFLGACSLFLAVDPNNAKGVTTTADLWKPTDMSAPPANKREQLQLYMDTMTAAGHADIATGFAWDYFSDTMNLAAILSTIDGDVTAQSVKDAFNKTVKLDSFMGPTISCDHSAWPGQSACGNHVLLYKVSDDGTQKAITPDFIDTSPYIKLLG